MKLVQVKNRKLNLGAGKNWQKDGWEVLDHSMKAASCGLKEQAWELPYKDFSFDCVFCSHMFEHISHFRIEKVICEINRVLARDGILRILTPDLKKIASAYVNNDRPAMELYIKEDTSGIKTTLGLGQAMLNFILSAGSDNYLLSSDLSTVICGYAHVSCYDYEMLSGVLMHYGFYKVRQCNIEDSEIEGHTELREGAYNKDANHTLVIECRKKEFIPFSDNTSLLRTGPYEFRHLLPQPWVLKSLRLLGRLYNLYGHISSKCPEKLKNKLRRAK